MTLAAITLEVHLRPATRTKLFSGLHAGPAAAVGSSPLAPPGVLPAPNRRAVELALRLALGLRAAVADESRWVRVHEFGRGAPRGYRIAQLDAPLARGGQLAAAGRRFAVEVVRLAEDTSEPAAPQRAGDPRIEVRMAPLAADEATAAMPDCVRAVLAIAEACGVAAGTEAGSCVLHLDAVVAAPESCPRATIVDVPPDRLARALALGLGLRAARRPRTLRLDGAADRLVVDRGPRAGPFVFLDPDLPPLRIDPRWIEQLREAVSRRG